jgi:hypothetical protein
MKTPTSADDFAETSESMPAAPASNATANVSGPTWKMKSTSAGCQYGCIWSSHEIAAMSGVTD